MTFLVLPNLIIYNNNIISPFSLSLSFSFSLYSYRYIYIYILFLSFITSSSSCSHGHPGPHQAHPPLQTRPNCFPPSPPPSTHCFPALLPAAHGKLECPGGAHFSCLFQYPQTTARKLNPLLLPLLLLLLLWPLLASTLYKHSGSLSTLCVCVCFLSFFFG